MHGSYNMARKPSKKAARPKNTHRITVSFPLPLYEEIKRVAAERHLSTSWVVRDAVQQQYKIQGRLPF